VIEVAEEALELAETLVVQSVKTTIAEGQERSIR
jgi:hypothetical protein